MGGYGSGRPARYPKSDQMLRLDLARLERRGYLRGGPTGMTWSWGGVAMMPVASSYSPWRLGSS